MNTNTFLVELDATEFAIRHEQKIRRANKRARDLKYRARRGR